MAKDEAIAVKDAIHKLQLHLFAGVQHESLLLTAGSLLSQNDYHDVVTERSIANLCGYPLCRNPLPSDRPRKSRYRISLKEHKVYDLHETYMYCSTSCVVNSRAFAGSLSEERRLDVRPARVNEIVRAFEGLSLGDTGEEAELGLSELKIVEKEEVEAGKVEPGPSNAIEGYVPQRDRGSKPGRSKNRREGSKSNHAKADKVKDTIFNEMDFTSTIIMNDEYSISKIPSGSTKADTFLTEMDFMSTITTNDEYSISKIPSASPKAVSNTKVREPKQKSSHKEMVDQFSRLEMPSASATLSSETKFDNLNEEKSVILMNGQLSTSEVSSAPCQRDANIDDIEAESDFHADKVTQSNASVLKPSLKSLDSKKGTRSISWIDDRPDSTDNRDLCEFQAMENNGEAVEGSGRTETGDDNNSFRFASAEACAMALSQASEAVASGESEVPYAVIPEVFIFVVLSHVPSVSEAGITILPPPDDMDVAEESFDVVNTGPAPLKWPRKSGISEDDFFESEDSWFDSPPEGFSLSLSPFATMFTALFEWTSSSSLAYTYGRNESLHEEYSSINGREYPRKIVLTGGRSVEIKQTLAGCLARALPGVVSDLGLPTPISSLEQGMACLLDTMSFIEPLPPFRMKQWQVVVLLFIDALSVCRISALTPHITSRRRLFHKVLDGAQISAEEYEVMKDLLIPLGRVPQFSAQSGG
ncbi:hypothetical protein RJ640_008814 [Escallonia rubra]|uniref:RNA polymerase II subunit B1 CTD phosphatase RPAP2 homolog n=1 Tax=Escallonia rubra TaxID=112253 RepID=A0AA88UAD6_9ASTE|nr:hypothetical protein RJ640_008814 [Escallonia rubra]